MEEVERKYWDADIAVEKIVVQVTSSDEDTDTATKCLDYYDTKCLDYYDTESAHEVISH